MGNLGDGNHDSSVHSFEFDYGTLLLPAIISQLTDALAELIIIKSAPIVLLN